MAWVAEIAPSGESWMKKVGWGEVLDYTGVEWRQEGRQQTLFGEIDEMYEVR